MKLKGKIIDIALDYLTHKPKITFQLNRQEDLFTNEFNSLQEQDCIEIKLDKETNKRGNQANKYFHKLINELATYNRGIGHAISDEEMKININLSYGALATNDDGTIAGAKIPKNVNIREFYPYAKWYKDKDNCNCYLFYKRTSDLNTKEMWNLIKGLEAECKKVGIETLEDREFRLMMEEYEKDDKRRK